MHCVRGRSSECVHGAISLRQGHPPSPARVLAARLCPGWRGGSASRHGWRAPAHARTGLAAAHARKARRWLRMLPPRRAEYTSLRAAGWLRLRPARRATWHRSVLMLARGGSFDGMESAWMGARCKRYDGRPQWRGRFIWVGSVCMQDATSLRQGHPPSPARVLAARLCPGWRGGSASRHGWRAPAHARTGLAAAHARKARRWLRMLPPRRAEYTSLRAAGWLRLRPARRATWHRSVLMLARGGSFDGMESVWMDAKRKRCDGQPQWRGRVIPSAALQAGPRPRQHAEPCDGHQPRR